MPDCDAEEEALMLICAQLILDEAAVIVTEAVKIVREAELIECQMESAAAPGEASVDWLDKLASCELVARKALLSKDTAAHKSLVESAADFLARISAEVVTP